VKGLILYLNIQRLRRVHSKKEAAPDLDCEAGVNKEGVGEGERGRKNGEPPPRLRLVRRLLLVNVTIRKQQNKEEN